jgi:flagellar basal-body rod modification protein FlgD
MATSSISSALNSASTKTGTSGDGLSGISSTDFMNILVKQLQMQDPMEPMSSEEMLGQLSTIRELEVNTRMSTKLEQLTDQQRFGSASALIGKQVTGSVEDDAGNAYAKEGIVTSVVFSEDGDVVLELDDGEKLPLSGLETIQNVTATTQPTTNTSKTVK